MAEGLAAARAEAGAVVAGAEVGAAAAGVAAVAAGAAAAATEDLAGVGKLWRGPERSPGAWRLQLPFGRRSLQ